MWIVKGGQCHDGIEVDSIPFGDLERYGPFSTYEEAYAQWRLCTFQPASLDNAAVRYVIEEIDE